MLDGKEEEKEEEQNQNFVFDFLDCEEKSGYSWDTFDTRIAKGFHP